MPSPYPELAQLRSDAKKLLRAARAGVSAALRKLPRSDREPLLADAQFAVARSVGFQSWPALVEAITASENGRHPAPAFTRVLLVRRADRVRSGRISGHEDGGLSHLGRSQTEALASHLAGDGVTAVLSSRRRASVEMADIIGRRLGLEPSQPTCDLCEMHPGESEGLTESERIVRFGPNASFVPGAEPWSDFLPRSVEALQGIARRHNGGTIVCVTENATSKASFVAFGEMAPRPAEATTVEPASITEWSCLVQGDVRRVGTWRLVRHNASR